jgi:SSS family solute:Na+ symporter
MKNLIDYAILGGYLLVLVGFGIHFHRKNENVEGYLLGGRKLPFIAVGLSCMMALLSSISIVSVPGEICNHGFTLFMLGPLCMPLSIPFFFLFTLFYFKLGSFTPYEYLEHRYNRGVRALIAISNFYTRVLYLGLVLYTTSKIFESAYGWPVWICILCVGVIGIAYAYFGGLRGMVWIDVLQFFILFFGLAALIFVLCWKIDGGAVEAVACAFREGHGIPQLREPSFYSLNPYVRLLFFLMLWNHIVGQLTHACSDQITVQRLLSTGNWKAGFKSQCVASLTSFLLMGLLYFIGFAVFTYYFQHPGLLGPGRRGDGALFRFLTTELPTPVPGLFLAALFAAILSTIDGGINAMATVYLKEIHVKFFNRNLSPEGEMTVSKRATIGVGIGAVALAIALDVSGRWLSQTVSEVNTIFVGIAAATLPAYLFAVLSRRTCPALIWGYTFLAFGELIGKNIWYVASRAAEQAFLKDPSVGMGWGGPLELKWLLLPLIVGAALLIPATALRKLRERVIGKTMIFLGIFFLGVALSFLWWYIFSNMYITDGIPRARSFAFHLPAAFILGCIALRFFPVQPKEKYQGLTLFSLKKSLAESGVRN